MTGLHPFCPRFPVRFMAGSRPLAVLAVLVAASLAGVWADDPIDAGTHNFKDTLIVLGNGRGDRDGGFGACPDTFVGDGIPDVFQAWMVMYAIQVRGDATVQAAFQDNNEEWISDVNAFSDGFGYYMAVSPGGRAYAVGTAEVCFPFTVNEENYDTAAFGIFAATDDPDDDGRSNLEEFQESVATFGLPPDVSTWTDDDWGTAFENLHGLGVAIGGGDGGAPADVMEDFAVRAFTPAAPPEQVPVGGVPVGVVLGTALALCATHALRRRRKNIEAQPLRT